MENNVISLFLAGRADETVPATAQAPAHKCRTLGVFLFGSLAKIQAPSSNEAPEKGEGGASDLAALIRLTPVRHRLTRLN